MIAAAVLFSPLEALAMENPMRPGLWEVKTRLKRGNSEVDPQAELKKSMADMPPERRKMMESMMAKSGMAIGTSKDSGTQLCYTKETLARKDFGTDPDRHCETTIRDKTSKHVAMDFKCKDGSTGTGEWNFPSSTAYDGKMKFQKKGGQTSEIALNGRFIDANCGDVRPLEYMKRNP